ncbi:MAG: hypothetical protein [Circular genetic element sp.]|nr:MAG: hypothetical protein [Circular genetic element sp.]
MGNTLASIYTRGLKTDGLLWERRATLRRRLSSADGKGKSQATQIGKPVIWAGMFITYKLYPVIWIFDAIIVLAGFSLKIIKILE